MRRVLILVMDSFGIGASDDADVYGDAGADTYGSIERACRSGEADREGLRQGPLVIPNLRALGLDCAAGLSRGMPPRNGCPDCVAAASWGYAAETSRGKDTPSGHWELAGVPVTEDWGYFGDGEPCFPTSLTDDLIARCRLPGILGNRRASGTEIIASLGQRHIRSGKPILYTSADSVLQIAAHELHFGLERLYQVCAVARELVDRYRIARVIARPFIGEHAGAFRRTGNRKDLATPPPAPTLLDCLLESGAQVIAIGKIGDIFAHRGISREIKADGNEALFDATLSALRDAGDRTLLFSNFVDFDMLYGHRRDVAGYAAALEAFDRRLPALHDAMTAGDLAIITADHGCDPTMPGSDHTREHVPVLAFGKGLAGAALGRRDSFADIGQTVAEYLRIPVLTHGRSFLPDLLGRGLG